MLILIETKILPHGCLLGVILLSHFNSAPSCLIVLPSSLFYIARRQIVDQPIGSRVSYFGEPRRDWVNYWIQDRSEKTEIDRIRTSLFRASDLPWFSVEWLL